MARFTRGWTKLHRKLLNNWISDDSATLSIWILLLMWANREESYSPNEGVIHKGQIITSSLEIASKLRLSRRVVDNRLFRLEKGTAIKQKKSQLGRVITICNYETYQQDKINRDSERATDGIAKGQPRDNEGTSNGEHGEYKEYKEGGEADSPSLVDSCILAFAEGYEEAHGFWPDYNLKEAHAAAKDLIEAYGDKALRIFYHYPRMGKKIYADRGYPLRFLSEDKEQIVNHLRKCDQNEEAKKSNPY